MNIHELDDGPKELSGPLTREWLSHILRDTDVQPEGPDPGDLNLWLTKTGPDVLVQGSLRAVVSLPCARTLDPAIYRLRAEVFLMLTPAAGAANSARRRRPEREKPPGAKKAAKKAGWETDPELSDEEAALDTYSGELIVLDEFLREFILLEVPMVPLREDLRGVPFEANPPLPDAGPSEENSAEKPIDPRLSPLRDLKARLENKE